MILSITDDIEVAEHTEPQERCEFLTEYREQIVRVGNSEKAFEFTNMLRCALLARQAE